MGIRVGSKRVETSPRRESRESWFVPAAGVAIRVSSLAFEPPARYVVQVVAQLVELSMPPLPTRIHRRVVVFVLALLLAVAVYAERTLIPAHA